MTWDRDKLQVERRAKLELQAENDALHRTSLAFLKDSYQFDYCYQWDWAGFPILNMPEDVMAYQEILFRCKPTVVIETGVAWGGGVAMVSSLMSLYAPMGKVLGIDLNLDNELHARLEELNLPVEIHLLEASSTDAAALAWVLQHISAEDRVMVILDSHHTHDHVLAELRAYAPIVTSGQFLIVGDTSIKDLVRATDRVRPWTADANPHSALEVFLGESSRFVRDPAVNGKLLTTFHPGGYLRKL